MSLRLIDEGWPVDEFVFFDTGWEFPQLLNEIGRFEHVTGREVVRLEPRYDFTFMLTEKPVHRRDGSFRFNGNCWPSAMRRWCTREKIASIKRYCADRVEVMYIGYAADEADRINAPTQHTNGYECKFPLVEWDMTEADCLAYCKGRGFTWGGLYDHFSRVSCFCCPLQPLKSVRTLRREFPDLWARMMEWDIRIGDHNIGFKGDATVHDLDKRFEQEDRQRYLPGMANRGGLTDTRSDEGGKS